MGDSPRRLEISHSSSFTGLAGGDNPDEFVARFQTTKLSWKGKYERIFALSATRFCTIDPKDFDVTNSWSYQSFVSFELDLNDDHVFTLVLVGPKKEEQLKLRYKYRAYLLTEFLRLHTANAQTTSRPPPPLQCNATKLTRLGMERECILEIAPDGLVYKEVLPTSQSAAVLERFPYTDIDHITPVSNSTTGCVVGYYGRQTVFFTTDRSFLIGNMDKAAARVGLRLATRGKLTLEQVAADKPILDVAECIVQFPVQKFSRRHEKPERRILALVPSALLELDPTSLTVLTSIPLCSLFAVIRHPGSFQFELEFVHGTHQRLYSCRDRDGVLAALYDAVGTTSSDKSTLEISSTPSQTGLRLLPRFAVEDMTETSSFFGDSSIGACFLKRLAAVGKYTIGSGIRAGAAAGRGLVSIAAEFNANVPLAGIQYHTKRSVVLEALKPLVVQLQTVAACQPPAPRTAVTLLQCLCRIASSFYGFRELLHFPNVLDSLRLLIVAEDELTVFWTALLLQRVTMHTIVASAAAGGLPDGSSPDGETTDKRATNGEAELNNKRMLFSQGMLVTGLVGVLGRFADRKAGPLSLMGNLQVLEGAICSHRHTTDAATVRFLVDHLVPHYDSLTRLLFQSRCTTTVESCTLLVQAVLRLCSSDAAASIKDAALRRGLVLQHLYQAIFDPSFDQRCVSRYMITMWMSDHAPAKHLLRRIFPPGLVSCLEMRLLSPAEECQLDDLEKTTFMDKFGAFNAELLLSRRSPSEVDNESFYDNGSDGLSVHSNHAISDTMLSSAKLLDRMHIKTTGTNVFDKSNSNHGATTSSVSSRSSRSSVLKDGLFNVQMLRRAITRGLGAAIPESSAPSPSATPSDRSPENFRILFHMVQQDHESIELVWTSATREELQTALSHEIHRFREIFASSTANVVWNYEDFSISYSSLENELVVDGMYLRHLLQCPVAAVSDDGEDAWRPPLHMEDMPVKKPKRFVTALYKKILREQGDAEFKGHVDITVSCLKALAFVTWVYEFEYYLPLEDVGYLLAMVESTTRCELLVHLLQVLRSVTKVAFNGAKLVKDPRAVPLLVALIQMAHVSQRNQPSTRGQAVWTCGANTLERKTLDEVRQYLKDNTNVNNHHESLEVPIGRWMGTANSTLGNIPQLKWEFGMDRPFDPVHVAHDAIHVLIALLKSNPLVTLPEVVVFPIPVGRQLTAAHIADMASILVLHELPKLSELAMHVLVLLSSSYASPSLYTTGVFYMLFLYKGDSFTDFASFLQATHQLQTVSTEPRHILADLLPPAMIDQLDLLNPAEFSALFCSGDHVESPRVIWNPTMRHMLWRNCLAHLDDHRATLQQDVATPYEYHPMAPVVYHEHLGRELYCHGYYLRQLFNSTEVIKDPVAFLTSLHDAWTAEVHRVAVGVSRDEAKATLELVVDDGNCDDVRDAYKRLGKPICPEQALADPDKLQRFERIQVAFAVLTSPRESLLTSGYDAVNLELLLRAQIYIVTTCAPALASSKLDAFPLLLDFLATHCTTDRLAVPPLTSHAEQLHLSLLATRLLRLSCAVSVQNIPWLLAQDQSGVVDDALQYVVTRMIDDNDPTDETTYIDTALELMQTVASLAGTSAGRQWIATTASHVLHNIWRILWYYHSFTSPPTDALFVLVRHTLEALCRMCDDATKDAPLPEQIAQNGGILWHLLDLWYAFDSAVDEQALARRLEPTVLFTEGGTTLHDDVGGHVQTLLATLSVRVFVAANKSNVTIQAVCHTLLSPNLYFQSTNPSAFKFLHLFHRDTMSHRLIWTSQMRSELKAFLAPLVNTPPASTPSSSVTQLGQSFRFSALKEHAIVDDIYLEPLHTTLSSSSFTANSVDVVRQLGLPPSFYTAAASFVRTGRLPLAAHGVVGWGITPDVELRFRELSLGILAALVPWATAQVEAGFMGGAAKSAHTGVLTLLYWVLPPEHKFMQTHPSLKEGVAALPQDGTVAFATFQSHSLTILHALAATKSFGDSLVESKVGLSVLMHAALMEDQHSGGLLETVGRLCASSHNVARYVTTSIWMYHLLIWAFPTPSVSGKSADASGMIMDADCDYTPSMQIPAMKILSILGNPTSLVLEDTINVMVRFLPVSLIYELVNRPQNVATILSGHYEAPDLVWNVTLRTHFYREMLQLVVIVNKCSDTEVISDELAQVDIDYASVYPYPMVGDVYLLLYLENPIHPLRDPKFFLECLFEDFEALGHALVTSLSQRSSFSPDLVMTVRQQTQILPMITSCIICALRVYPVYLDDVASWKVPDKVASLFVLLQNELRLPQPKEEEAAAVVAEVSLLRVFRVLFVSPRIVSSLAYSPYNLLSRLISHCHNLSTHKSDLHPEVGFILEVVRRFLLSFPDNGDKNSDKNVVAVVCGLNVMEMLLDMIEHPMTLQRVVNPILTRTTVIAILNYLEQHRTQGALAHHILKKHKKWDKVFRHEPTDAIRNQPEDKYLVGPAASADAMIRSFLANKAKADDTSGPHSGGSLSPPSSRRKGGPSTSQKLKNLFR